MKTVIIGGSHAAISLAAQRVQTLTQSHTTVSQRLGAKGQVLEFHSSRLPDGGLVISFADVTARVDAETALPFGLILHELVVNSFRHAFPDGAGTVKVRLERQPNGQPLLLVEDDGRGLPPGLDVERAEALGLQLVTSLAAQVGARLEVRSSGGTAFRFEVAA